jgi:hypothetical protein
MGSVIDLHRPCGRFLTHRIGGHLMLRLTSRFPALVLVALIPVAVSQATDTRTILQHTGDGAILLETTVDSAPPGDGSGAVVPVPQTGVIWQRTLTDAIYTTCAISRPLGTVAAGTYLNPPEEAELIPLDGDGTPTWVDPGMELYMSASRDGEVIAGVDFDSSVPVVTVKRWAPGSSTPLWTTDITPASRGSYRTILVSPDGTTIAVLVTIQDDPVFARLYLFSPDSSTPIGIYDGPGGFGRNLSIGEDGRFTAFIGLATAYVVDRDADAIRWSGSMGASNDPIAISTDGSYLAFGWTSLQMRTWDGVAYATSWTTPGGGYSLKSVAFSSDNSTFVSAWYRSGFDQNRINLHEMPSATPLWTYLYDVGGGSYQDVPYDVALTAHGEFVAVGSWGDQLNTNPEVHVFPHDDPNPIFTADTPGSVFDIDIAIGAGLDVRVTSAGKGVHANQTGRGGDLLSMHIGEPVAVGPAGNAMATPLRIATLPNPYRPHGAIRLDLDRPSAVDVAIFSSSGRRVPGEERPRPASTLCGGWRAVGPWWPGPHSSDSEAPETTVRSGLEVNLEHVPVFHRMIAPHDVDEALVV